MGFLYVNNVYVIYFCYIIVKIDYMLFSLLNYIVIKLMF